MFNLHDNLKNKKFLIYGYGKTGSSAYNYLKKAFQKNEFFHNYLKKEPREGRKMGHLTILKD